MDIDRIIAIVLSGVEIETFNVPEEYLENIKRELRATCEDETTIKIDDYEVTFQSGEVTKQKVFDRVIKFCVDNRGFWGESIMQCDNSQINAPEVLAELTDDVLKFDVKDA